MTIDEFLGVLTRQIPLESAAPWDPVGLQLGDGGASANSVAVCHEVTPQVVAACESQPPDLLISYHPLLFDPVARLVLEESAPGRAFRLTRAGVALVVVHTAFDVASGGAADALADAIGLDSTSAFASMADPDSASGAGNVGMAGRVGDLASGTTVGDLAATVERILGSTPRTAGDLQSSITRAAVVPGSGSDFFEDAVAVGAEAIVTADVSHHRARRALDMGLAVIDPGHAATERPGVTSLYAAVLQIVPTANLMDHDPDPWS